MHHPAAGTEDLFLGQVGHDTAKVRCQRLSQGSQCHKGTRTGNRKQDPDKLKRSVRLVTSHGAYIFTYGN